MNSGETFYLLLAIGAFVLFGLALAWATWSTTHK